MHTTACPPALLEWVDFKWLMAGAGHPVHLERLQCDRDYARRCLQLGLASSCPTLCERARRLLASLQA